MDSISDITRADNPQKLTQQVIRMEEHRIPHKVLQLTIHNKRRVGKPRKIWELEKGCRRVHWLTGMEN